MGDNTKLADALSRIAAYVGRNSGGMSAREVADFTVHCVACMIDGVSDWHGIEGPMDISIARDVPEKMLTGNFYIHDQLKHKAHHNDGLKG